MKRALVVLALAFAPAVALAAPATDCGARPAWCQSGYTCEPTSCTARSTAALEGLMSQVQAARATRPRWFRPFLEGGLTDGFAGQGLYGAGGVILWRHLVVEGDVAKDAAQQHAQVRIGFRREW